MGDRIGDGTSAPMGIPMGALTGLCRAVNKKRMRLPAHLITPFVLCALTMLVLVFCSGCGIRAVRTDQNGLPAVQKTEAEPSTLRCGLIISRDYGTEVLRRERVFFEPGDSVLDVTERVVSITTRYGGGFVQSIDGITSKNASLTSAAYDWFFSVNGTVSGVGSREVDVFSGDVIWWDYHCWAASGGAMQAATLAWPKPFDRESLILVSENTEQITAGFVAALESLGKAAGPKRYDWGALADRKTPTMLLLLKDEIERSVWLKDLMRHAWRAGLPGAVLDGAIVGFDEAGRVAKRLMSDATLVIAYGSGMGDDAPLWIIVGSDADALQSALKDMVSMLEDGKEVPCSYGMLFSGDGILGLPIVGSSAIGDTD